MHDYVHQMILGETDPQIMNLRVLGDEAPLKGFREAERKAVFHQNRGVQKRPCRYHQLCY